MCSEYLWVSEGSAHDIARGGKSGQKEKQKTKKPTKFLAPSSQSQVSWLLA